MPSTLLNPPRPQAATDHFRGTAGRRFGRHLKNPSVLLFVILTAQLMVVLDTTIVNVALPHIQRGLGFSASGLSWVLNAYILTFGGLLLLGARAGDLLGRRRVFLAGIALFCCELTGRQVSRPPDGCCSRPGPCRASARRSLHLRPCRSSPPPSPKGRRGSGPSASTPRCRPPVGPSGS